MMETTSSVEINLSSTELKERLVEFARQLGFDSCRIASATAPQHVDEFRSWLDEGSAGDMQYMARGSEKRADPQQVLAGAMSVVSLALNYWQGSADERNTRSATKQGRIARYAWGDDYHEVIEAKLARLDQFLIEH